MPDGKQMVKFLKNSQNKTKLNKLIQQHASNPLFWRFDGEVTITSGDRILSTTDGPR